MNTLYPSLGLLAQQLIEAEAEIEWNKLHRAVELIVAQIDDEALSRLIAHTSHLRWIGEQVSLTYYRRQAVIEQETEGLMELVDPETEPVVREELRSYYSELAGQAETLEPAQRATVVCAAKGVFLKAKRKQQVAQVVQPATSRHFEAGAIPEPGMLAWVVIEKKGGGRKQAKCLIEVVEAEQVTVIITKTGQQVRRPVAELFDHVPHLVDGVWV